MNQKTENAIQITKINADVGADVEKLDDSQAAAVLSHDKRVILRASPGSGKTWSIINAIAQYRYENLNDRICAITYTRAARADMEARLQELGVYDVEVTTIHVWARNLLEDFSIKYDFRVRILQEPAIREILHTIVSAYTKTSKVKSINEDIVYSFVMGNKNMDISDKYRNTLAALDRRYIAYKKAKVLYDFTDYPQYLYDILCTYDETIHLDALFVDEFQDVDSTQYDVFRRVQCKKFFAVGDPWQSIYMFRGADGEVFSKILKEEGTQQFKLRYNYRSYQEIIDYANTVHEEVLEELAISSEAIISSVTYKEPTTIKCVRGDGGYVYVSDRYGRHFELHKDKINRVERDYIFKNMLSRKPMILCRTNKQVAALNSLGYFECSTVHQAKGLQYDNVVVIDNVIKNTEDLNVAYVALTRARNRVWVISWGDLSAWIDKYI